MSLPTDWLPLLGLAFVFGAKHGLDADHLATIDGLTRYNLRQAPGRARWCGSLFSLGHGAVVIAIAAAVGLASRHWEAPSWLDALGTWISIGFLLLIGTLNLHAVLSTPADTMVGPVGLRSLVLRRLQATSHPLAIAAVGALFALSFDTVSQAALMAAAANQHGGPGHALALGLAFTLGMLLADGINGLWIAGLLRRADRRARLASRAMGLLVAGLSFAVAGFGLVRLADAGIAGWYEGKELALGLAFIATVVAGYAAAALASRRATGAPARHPV